MDSFRSFSLFWFKQAQQNPSQRLKIVGLENLSAQQQLSKKTTATNSPCSHLVRERKCIDTTTSRGVLCVWFGWHHVYSILESCLLFILFVFCHQFCILFVFQFCLFFRVFFPLRPFCNYYYSYQILPSPLISSRHDRLPIS